MIATHKTRDAVLLPTPKIVSHTKADREAVPACLALLPCAKDTVMCGAVPINTGVSASGSCTATVCNVTWPQYTSLSIQHL